MTTTKKTRTTRTKTTTSTMTTTTMRTKTKTTKTKTKTTISTTKTRTTRTSPATKTTTKTTKTRTKRKSEQHPRSAPAAAGVDPRPRAGRGGVRAAPRPHAGPRAAHGLRRGPLPEPRGLLEPRHRHVHDPGGRVHPRVRVLRGQDRAARTPARPRRSPPRGGRRRPHAPAPRRDHLGQPRRPGGRRGGRLRGLHPRDPLPRARLHGGGADPGLQGGLGRAARRPGRPAGHPQPQYRDRAPALPPRAAGGAVRA